MNLVNVWLKQKHKWQIKIIDTRRVGDKEEVLNAYPSMPVLYNQAVQIKEDCGFTLEPRFAEDPAVYKPQKPT